MEIQAEIERLNDSVAVSMGAAERLTWQGKTLATWRLSKGAARLDGDRLKRERPDIVERYTVNCHDDAQSQAHLRATKLPSFRLCLERSAMSEEGFIGALLQTSLSRLDAWTLPDLERLLAACLRYNLSPTGREIFLVPDHATGAPLLVVGVDGWSRVLNEHKQFAGMRFRESVELVDGIPAWIECTIHRRDRRVATAVREYLCEVRGTTTAWITHPRRMLRHKAMVQCARITFGMGEIVDPDEAHRTFASTNQQTEGPTQTLPQKSHTPAKRGPTSVNELKSALGL